MMRGTVSPGRRALVPLTVLGGDGTPEQVTAILDTGFSGGVTLPLTMIVRLGWRLVGGILSHLADDSRTLMDMYEGRVVVDGETRSTLVFATEQTTLVRMSLLYGSRLTIDIVDGGSVIVEPLG